MKIAIILILLTATVWGQNNSPESFRQLSINSIEEANDFSSQAQKLLIENYYKKIEPKKLALAMIQGLRSALKDPYIEYLDKREYQYIQKGKFKGIGIMIGLEKRRVKIIRTMASSPAQKAGLQSGDIIVNIDGKDAQSDSLGEMMKLLRSNNAKVHLKIYRPSLKKQLEITIIRAEFEVSQIQYRLIKDVGYAHLKTIPKATSKKFRKLCDLFNKNGIKGMILDMRNCVGGHLDEAVKIADAFLSQGVITQIHDKKGKRSIKSDKEVWFSGPVVVLVNKLTLSSAEIIVGALKERGRAIIVGTNTGGKGTIQKLFPLKDGALKLTIGVFLTPNENKVDKKGIAPNIQVEQPKSAKEDRQWKRGYELIQALIPLQKQR